MRGRRWIILAILFLARGATGFQFQSIGSSAKMLMRDLDIDYSQIGMLLGAYLLPGILVSLPAGLFGQHFRERKLGLAGLALMVFSGVAFGCSGGFGLALAARSVGGVGATMLALAASKTATDWFENHEIVLAMSLLQMSWPFGAMLALPIQAYVAQWWGWPMVMISSALCAGTALCAFVLVTEVAPSALPRAVGRATIPMATLLSVTVAGTIWGALNLSCILFFSYAPLLLAERGSSTTGAASLVSLAVWLTILAIPCGGYVIQRSGRSVAAIIICAGAAAAALALFIAGFYPTACCLMFGVAVGPMSGAILSLPSKVLSSQDRSVGFGVFYTCFYILMAVGPLIAGYLQDVWRTPSAGLAAVVAVLVAIIPFVVLFVSMQRPPRLAERRAEPRRGAS